jgi:hypothetical protein
MPIRFLKSCWNDEIKKNGTEGACGTYWVGENACRIWWGNMKEVITRNT